MDIHIEKEYKILVDEKQFKILCAQHQPLSFIRQVNYYFDTPNKDIQKQKGAMRIRTSENTHMFTLKLPSETGLMEYECSTDGHRVEDLHIPQIVDLLASIHVGIEEVVNTLELTTERAVFETEVATLCFDKSTYYDTTDYEIEYEYKKEHDGLTIFQSILEPIEIQYESNCISKIQRAMNAKKE